MLSLRQQKHIICFDDRNSTYSSYQFELRKFAEKEEADKNKSEPSISSEDISEFYFQIKIEHKFSYEWSSEYYRCEYIQKKNNLGSCPLSLQNYLEYYQDPKVAHFRLTLSETIKEEGKKQLEGNIIGKIIVKSFFKSNILRLPLNIIDFQNPRFSAQCQKKSLCVITEKSDKQFAICAAKLIGLEQVKQVPQFYREQPAQDTSFLIYLYQLNERIQSSSVVVAKGQFKLKQLMFDNAIIRIYTTDKQIFFMQGLLLHLQQLKVIMGQIEPLFIIQNVQTQIEDGYRTVFYSDTSSLYHRIFKSYLYDKIKDKWITQGMVYFNRSNKHFQDVVRELIDLMTEGEQVAPLQNDTFCFDQVWKLKAIFFYHILSNFKTLRDYGSSSLANLIIEESKKNKITSQVLFRRLKNKYGLRNFRTIYEHQFVKSTGLNRIFYEIIDLKRENRVKIIVRQKSLANKVFRMYNFYRIKLEQEYDLLSHLSSNIISKNKFFDKANKKKEFSGPLAVPKILKCLPYFKGIVSVETDASQMPFELQLKQQNIIEEKQNVTSKIRAPIRKMGEGEKSYEGFGWIMIDTAYIFPAVYKNENVHESVILQKIKKKYDSEHEQIKMLNCISSRDHSSNQKICRALIEKVKINTVAKENCSINVKRKILQILPVFLSKVADFTLWQDMLSFLKLYEPVCHDYSEEGYFFLISLIESIGEIQYRKQFGYYFEHFHDIMLKILKTNNFNNEEKELRLKMVLFDALMKWKSCYSLQILSEVEIELKMSQCTVRGCLQTLKIIFKNIFKYIQSLKLSYNSKVASILKLTEEIIKKDKTYTLFAIKLQFDLQENNLQQTNPLVFLKNAFSQLQSFREQNLLKYGQALQVVKNSLSKHKKVYGLEIQVNLKENQNFFIAQYLWKQLISPLSCRNHFIRLQWLKIYRIFYFYFTPIVTLRKIKNNAEARSFKKLQPEQINSLLEHTKCFTPDIKWYSGYDSRSAKELKAKYEQMNDNRKKKKFDEYNFSENNVITLFIKQHPGRQTWDQLAREAIKTFISIYEDKQQKSEGKEAQRQKQIQQGFKKIEQKLKRGRMPDFYSYELLKEEVVNLMAQFKEEEQKVMDILHMVDKALQEIAEQKGRREAELKDEMRIKISFDDIIEEPYGQEEEQRIYEDAQDNQNNEDDDLVFREEDNYQGGKEQERQQQNGQNKGGEQGVEDEDELMFGS